MTKPTYIANKILTVNDDGSVLNEIAAIVRNENEPDVDHYAFISDTRGKRGIGGWAPMGMLCDNRSDKWGGQKISISSGPTLSNRGGKSALLVARLVSHELGHNLGMHHDFKGWDQETDNQGCKNLDGNQVSCKSCNNWFNKWTHLFDDSDLFISHRKLSSDTGNSGDCCTGIMDYGNPPLAWSTCAVRNFEEAYMVQGWYQCLQ